MAPHLSLWPLLFVLAAAIVVGVAIGLYELRREHRVTSAAPDNLSRLDAFEDDLRRSA